MDVLNDNDEDNNMDIDDSLNRDNNSNNEEEDNIDHNRLRELANFADQRGLANGEAETTRVVDREEMRVGETKMVSNLEPERYEGTGISLDWGEYYVPSGGSGSSADDDESSLSSCEEAEEINDEEVNREIEQVAALTNSNISQNRINFEQLDTNVDTSNPTLMGMPDIILEKIIQFSTEQPSEVCVLERVCKRINKMTTNDEFWARHPSSKCWSEFHITWSSPHQGLYTADLPLTRTGAFKMEAWRNIKKYKMGTRNAILDVLGDGSECVASTFRTISADILSRMTHLGSEVHFRLRGDTIGYIAELLQGYMIDRFNAVTFLAIHRQGSNPWDSREDRRVVVQVQADDIALAFRRQTALFNHFLSSCYSSSNETICDVSAGYHGQVESPIDCSCSLPSSSGTVWRWPLDNCREVLPAEAGRRIIRRLAYFANISEMSNDAFILAEAELLHALGGLLVSAYESCVDIEKTRKTQLLGAEEELTYDEPNEHVPNWMFKSSPPPFHPKPSIDDYQHHLDDAVVYTIVPGQIETAAEQRDISPRKVYGEAWVAISGFSPEEEKKTEKSYYYKETFHNDDSEESDSESVENDEDSSIDYEMDMHQYYDSREDDYLYYDSDMELDLHYDSVHDEMYSHEPDRPNDSV